jgi:hypothetical protein
MVRRLTPTSSHAFMIEIVLRSVIMLVHSGPGFPVPKGVTALRVR